METLALWFDPYSIMGQVNSASIIAAVNIFFYQCVDKKKVPDFKDRIEYMDLYFCHLFIPFLVWLAWGGVTDLGGDIESRFYGSSASANLFMMFYCWKMVHGMFIVYCTSATRRIFFEMSAHHIFSAVAMGSGLYLGRMKYYGCLDGLCETTSLFLNFMFLLKKFEWRDGIVYPLNGLFLWFSFIPFRLILFPCWIYYVIDDVMSENSPLNFLEGRTTATVTSVELIGHISVNVLLFSLSCAWMWPITTGLLKALGVLKPKQAAKKTD